MARLDALCLLSDAQAFSASGVSSSSYDVSLITPNRQIGDGRPLAITIQIDVAADFASSNETYSFEAIQSASSALTTPTILSSQAYIASGVLISTLLVKGYVLVLPIPAGMPLQRFVGFNLTAGGTTPSVTLTAWLGRFADAPIKPQTYPKGYTIS